MTRDSFIQAMTELRCVWQEAEKYEHTLNKIGIEIDEPPHYKLLDTMLSILSVEIDDTYGYVQLFVFEMDWGKQKTVYDPFLDAMITIRNSGELFDYIQERNKR